MLGVKEPLTWVNTSEGLVIDISQQLQDPAKRPCQHAWAFKIVQGQPNEFASAPRVAYQGPPAADQETFTFISRTKSGQIRFTTDGEVPTGASRLYTGPITLPKGTIVKARAFKQGFLASDVVTAVAGTLRVNFQTQNAPVPPGYLADTGKPFGPRESGLTYGWSTDQTKETRWRSDDVVLGTCCELKAGQKWEIALPRGWYKVLVCIGDADYGSENTINVEGVNYCRNLVMDNVGQTRGIHKRIYLEDGKLTIDNGKSKNRRTKINHVHITPLQQSL